MAAEVKIRGIEYDPVGGSVYILLERSDNIDIYTEEVAPDVLVDVDGYGNPVGVEIVDAAEFLGRLLAKWRGDGDDEN